jgi:hypothetical protein
MKKQDEFNKLMIYATLVLALGVLFNVASSLPNFPYIDLIRGYVFMIILLMLSLLIGKIVWVNLLKK